MQSGSTSLSSFVNDVKVANTNTHYCWVEAVAVDEVDKASICKVRCNPY